MNLRQWAFGVLSAAVLSTAYGAANSLKRNHVEPEPIDRGSYRPGTQILFVYIGAEDCLVSLTTDFAGLVRAAKRSVKSQAATTGKTFSTLGISAGQSARLGVDYLNRFGAFNEISTGNGWLNHGTMHYIFENLAGPNTVPQIVVIERHLELRVPGYSFKNERVLVRAVGYDEIKQWSRDGAPLW